MPDPAIEPQSERWLVRAEQFPGVSEDPGVGLAEHRGGDEESRVLGEREHAPPPVVPQQREPFRASASHCENPGIRGREPCHLLANTHPDTHKGLADDLCGWLQPLPRAAVPPRDQRFNRTALLLARRRVPRARGPGVLWSGRCYRPYGTAAPRENLHNPPTRRMGQPLRRCRSRRRP